MYTGCLSWGYSSQGMAWSPNPSCAKVKGRVELYLYSPSGPSWPVLGWNLPFTVLSFLHKRNLAQDRYMWTLYRSNRFVLSLLLTHQGSVITHSKKPYIFSVCKWSPYISKTHLKANCHITYTPRINFINLHTFMGSYFFQQKEKKREREREKHDKGKKSHLLSFPYVV